MCVWGCDEFKFLGWFNIPVLFLRLIGVLLILVNSDVLCWMISVFFLQKLWTHQPAKTTAVAQYTIYSTQERKRGSLREICQVLHNYKQFLEKKGYIWKPDRGRWRVRLSLKDPYVASSYVTDSCVNTSLKSNAKQYNKYLSKSVVHQANYFVLHYRNLVSRKRSVYVKRVYSTFE